MTALVSLPLAAAGADPAEPVQRLAPVTVDIWLQTMRTQDLPAAVSTLDAEGIAALALGNFDAVAWTAPNTNVQRRFGPGSGAAISMRGQDMGSSAFEADARMAMYLDNVYMGRYGASSAFVLTDLCGVTVLPGPQGALFGRNGTAGTVMLHGCAPGRERGAQLELGMGNYRQREARLHLDSGRMAFAGGSLAARLALLDTRHDGYVRNERPGVVTSLSAPFGTVVSTDTFGRAAVQAQVFTATYEHAQDLTLSYREDRSLRRSSQLAVQLLGLYGGIAGLYDPALGTGGAAPSLARRDSAAAEFMGTDRVKVGGRALSLHWRPSSQFSLKYILSRRSMDELGGGNDLDGASFNGGFLGPLRIPTADDKRVCYFCTDSIRHQRQTSNELRLSTQLADWHLSGGAFALRETGQADAPVFVGGRFDPDAVNTVGSLSALARSDYYSGSAGTADNRSCAVFGHASWALTPALTLSAGLRRSWDRRDTVVLRGALGESQGVRRFAYTDWELDARYRLREGLGAYARAASAHLPGGVQSGVAFEPEADRSIEVGLKSEFPEAALGLNVAIFHNEVARNQLLQFSPQIGPYTINAGNGQQRGLELQLEWRPSADLSLNAAYGYVHARNSLGLQPLTPRQSLNLSTDVLLARPRGMPASFRLDAAWRGHAAQGNCPINQATTPQGCVGKAETALTQATRIPARLQLALNFTLDEIALGAGAKGRLRLWMRNALDSRRLEFARGLGNGTVVGTFEAPRTLGASFSVSF